MKAFALLWLFVVFIGISILLLLPTIIRHEIDKYMKLTEGSNLYRFWSANRTGSCTEFYLFSVLNPHEVVRGEKPALLQLGPYTYTQTTVKVNLTSVPENGTIQYADKNIFIFNATLSHGKESDNVTIVNLAYLGIAAKATEFSKFMDIILNLIEKYYGSELFLTKTAKEIIWGYEDPVLKALSIFIGVSPMVGLYVNKNVTAGSILEINDGLKDISKIGQILSVNNQTKLSIWKTDLANQINGSDGSIFPPHLTSSSQLHVYSDGICRSLEFNAGQLIDINGVTTVKFELSNKTFLSPDLNPDNQGYCLDFSNCPKSGVIDMRSCMNGAPIFISLPHFNQADRSYHEAVIGMSPRSDMIISLNIESQTGSVLEARQMVQINALVARNSNFKALQSVTNVTLPVGYINSSVFVDPSVAWTLQTTLIWPQLAVNICSILLIILGIWGLIVTLLKLFKRGRSFHRSIVLAADNDDTTPMLNDDTAVLQTDFTNVEA